jgi:hypothetical protein
MVIPTPIERETLQVCLFVFLLFFFKLHISQTLNVSTFGNTAGISAIVHLVPHAFRHIVVDGHACYYCLLATNQGNYVCELFLKKTWKVSLSIGVIFTMIRCVVCLLLIFKLVHGLMNNPVQSFWEYCDSGPRNLNMWHMKMILWGRMDLFLLYIVYIGSFWGPEGVNESCGKMTYGNNG